MLRNKISLPDTVNTIFRQLTIIIEDANIDLSFFAKINHLTIDDLHKHYRLPNGESHSLAEWAHLADRQDILNWLYKRAMQMPDYNAKFDLHRAITCWQPKETLEHLAHNRHILFVKRNLHGSHDTPLHTAVHVNNIEAASFLIKAMNDDRKLNFDNTALHLAIRSHQNNMVQLLIESGASLTHLDEDGNTALHTAVASHNLEAMKLIISTGRANPNIRNKHDESPVHLALYHARESLHTELAILSEETHLDLNLRDKHLRTPLELAIWKGQDSVIEEWLKKSAAKSKDNEEHSNDIALDQKSTLSEDTLNRAFNFAIKNRKTEAASLILPYITSIKDEFKIQCQTLKRASQPRDMALCKAIFEKRIRQYRDERTSDNRAHKRQFLFFKGYSRQEKIAATEALLTIFNDHPNWADIKRYQGALRNGELGDIYKLIKSTMPNLLEPSPYVKKTLK